jgi:hypothetical protein
MAKRSSIRPINSKVILLLVVVHLQTEPAIFILSCKNENSISKVEKMHNQIFIFTRIFQTKSLSLFLPSCILMRI